MNHDHQWSQHCSKSPHFAKILDLPLRIPLKSGLGSWVAPTPGACAGSRGATCGSFEGRNMSESYQQRYGGKTISPISGSIWCKRHLPSLVIIDLIWREDHTSICQPTDFQEDINHKARWGQDGQPSLVTLRTRNISRYNSLLLTKYDNIMFLPETFFKQKTEDTDAWVF